MSKELVEAARAGKLEDVKKLCESGVDINGPNPNDPNKRTALMTAIHFGHISIVKYLIEKGAKVDLEDKVGGTALLYAVFSTETSPETKKAITSLLLEKLDPKFINRKYALGKTVAEFAKGLGLRDVELLLYKHGAEKPPANLDQMLLLRKFSHYLNLMSKTYPDTYKKDDVEKIMQELGRGHCSGFAINWLYRKSKEEDSILLGNLRLISDWDESLNSLQEQENGKQKPSVIARAFERTINDVRFAQEKFNLLNEATAASKVSKTPIVQKDADIILNVLKQEKEPAITREFSISYIFKKAELIETLEESVLENKMIYITGISSVFAGHAIGVMKKNNLYYLYDSNAEGGEKSFNTIQELEEEIENVLYKNFNLKTDNIPINIEVFDFKNPDPNYVSPYSPYLSENLIKSFIKKNNDIDRRAWNNYTSLDYAIYQKDWKTFLLLLRMGINVVAPDSAGNPPLITAILFNHRFAINNLLPFYSPANPEHLYCLNSAVLAAAHVGDVKTLESLAQHFNPNFNVISAKYNLSAIGLAAMGNHIKAVQYFAAQPNIFINYSSIAACKTPACRKILLEALIRNFKNYSLAQQRQFLSEALLAKDAGAIDAIFIAGVPFSIFTNDQVVEALALFLEKGKALKRLPKMIEIFSTKNLIDINTKDSHDKTVLDYSIEDEDIETTKALCSSQKLIVDFKTLKNAQFTSSLAAIVENHLRKHFASYPLDKQRQFIDKAIENRNDILETLFEDPKECSKLPPEIQKKLSLYFMNERCIAKRDYTELKDYVNKNPGDAASVLPFLKISLIETVTDADVKEIKEFLANFPILSPEVIQYIVKGSNKFEGDANFIFLSCIEDPVLKKIGISAYMGLPDSEVTELIDYELTREKDVVLALEVALEKNYLTLAKNILATEKGSKIDLKKLHESAAKLKNIDLLKRLDELSKDIEPAPKEPPSGRRLK